MRVSSFAVLETWFGLLAPLEITFRFAHHSLVTNSFDAQLIKVFLETNRELAKNELPLFKATIESFQTAEPNLSS